MVKPEFRSRSVDGCQSPHAASAFRIRCVQLKLLALRCEQVRVKSPVHGYLGKLGPRRGVGTRHLLQTSKQYSAVGERCLPPEALIGRRTEAL
jgi:hypothetical protein